MKKIALFFIAAVVLAAGVLIPTNVTAAETYPVTDASVISDCFDRFVTDHQDRTIGTKGEKDAANYLADAFIAAKLQPYFSSKQIDYDSGEILPDAIRDEFLQTFTITDNTVSQNVVGYLPSSTGSNHTVVIGAHYDNVYGFELGGNLIRSQGAYDNGTGIAVMLGVLDAVRKQPSEYNLVFAAFGAEESGLYGSKKFVGKMRAEKKEQFENLLIMYNLDSVGAGDYLYLYTDDVQTGHGEYLYALAEELNLPVRKPPRDKRIFMVNGEYDSLPYSHVGQMSDHASFYNAGKNVAFFFTMNWETSGKTGAVESEKYDAIMHTKNDTLENVKKLYGETYLKYMKNAGDLIAASIYKSDFEAQMLLSYSNRINYSFWTNWYWAALIGGGVVLLFIAAILLLYYSYKKKSKPIVKVVDGFKNTDDDSVFVFGGDLDPKPASDGIKPKGNDDDDPFGDFFQS